MFSLPPETRSSSSSIIDTSNGSNNDNDGAIYRASNLGVKKIPVVPVSYREIRVGRSEINFFSWFWRFFAGRFAVECRHQY